MSDRDAFERALWHSPVSSAAEGSVPVYRASLPEARTLLRYLDVADRNGWYTNRGQLVCDLERRLTEILGASTSLVVSAASGTAALEAAILATAGRGSPQRPLALLPAYTFVATAMAAERCGYVPYLVDVDPETWSLAAGQIAQHPALSRAGVVVTVAPYGRPQAQSPWRDFFAATGVAVVIDGAAAFEALASYPATFTGSVPVALSFHATKAFSTAEGGAVVWSDLEGLARVVQALNFGFLGTRESTASGTNGRMSEYHAAVGLATLDAWDATQAAHERMADAYRRCALAYGLDGRVIVAPLIASNYAIFLAASAAEASDVVSALAEIRIETRFWYGYGLHREAYFKSSAADALPTAESIAARLVGLPAFQEITVEQIELIVKTIARVSGKA